MVLQRRPWHLSTLGLQFKCLLSFTLDTLQLKWMEDPLSTIFVFAKQKSKIFAVLTIVAVIPPEVNTVRSLRYNEKREVSRRAR